MSIRFERTLLIQASFVLLLLTIAAAPADAHLAAAARCQPAYQQASGSRAQADAAISKGDYRMANRVLDSALSTLGTAYHRKEMIDDTGMHLTLARIEEGKGRLKRAALSKRRVLTERLQLCTMG